MSNALKPKSFDFAIERGVATVTLNRPDRLNSLTFEVYRELADLFAAAGDEPSIRAMIVTGRGRGFCSGGDQDDIIADLFRRDAAGLVDFTRLTGRLIHNIRRVRRPVIAAVNGVAVGAGAVIAAACDLRIAAAGARFGFIFPRVGLSGADMGAAYLLPRLVGLTHASELLFLGDLISAERALEIGLVNRVVSTPEEAVTLAREWVYNLSKGPAFAHAMTKQMLEDEATMSLAAAIEAEAQAQALCMQHSDFRTAHDAFKAKQTPSFAGAPESEK